MSSIYKKSRDGYYYYQTYVYNQETGLKDKKIFHALRTKDVAEAQKKKKEYDNIYSKNKNVTKRSSSQNNPFKYKFFFILLFIFSLTFLFKISEKNQNNKIEYSQENIDNNSIEIKNPTLSNINDNSRQDLEVPYNKINEKSEKISLLKYKNNQTTNDDRLLNDIIENETPDYTVRRVEILSEAFKQGKIHATVEKELNSEMLRVVCGLIKNDFKQFTNVIICLYEDNDIGVSLSKGLNNKINAKSVADAWLVFYTFNPVEGEYFDDKPSSYKNGYGG